MESLWAKYQKELGDGIVLEKDNGFIQYNISGKECFIQEMYVEPDQRHKGIGQILFNEVLEVAKKHGCSSLTSTVRVGKGDHTRTVLCGILLGMKILSVNNNVIVLIKELL